jgi:hypothetical protein
LNTGLWRINLRHYKPHLIIAVANNVYELRNTGALVTYLHKAVFSPTKSALLQAMKNGHLTTWPGLTEQVINKHLKMTPATAMIHMSQRLQNIHSTCMNSTTSAMEYETVTPASLGSNTHLVYDVVTDQGQLYTDLTGRFTVISRKGNWYVMICYSDYCTYVKTVPMKSMSAFEWLKSYGVIHQEFTSKGIKPKLQTLDNEASAEFKSIFTENYVEHQLVTLHCHIHNAAHRAIKPF